MIFSLNKESPVVEGQIHLDGSKSISNRALMIKALSKKDFPIRNLSTSEDTVAMERLLRSQEGVLDTGPAGTTFRFLTAYLATQPGEQILTGSERMKQRPIGPLVDALNKLGANISYVEQEGFPPLRIESPIDLGRTDHLVMPGDISSQFISALVMIGPVMPKGLRIEIKGDLVSASYLQMTLSMLQDFGVSTRFHNNVIHIPPQLYQGKQYMVESDWSAASYHYAIAALAQEVSLTLTGLKQESMQGDSATTGLFAGLGVQSSWSNGSLELWKSDSKTKLFEHDFIRCPDVAQTIAVTLAGLGIPGVLKGLKTLSIKETDRIAALRTELAKVNVSFDQADQNIQGKGSEKFMVKGKASWSDPPLFASYHDHRMAMAFAPLGLLGTVRIEDPKVVGKSYPDFWKDLTSLGFAIQLED